MSEKLEIIKDLFHTIGFDRAALYPLVSIFIVSHADCDHLTDSAEQWIPTKYRGHKNLRDVQGPLLALPWKGYWRPLGERRIKVKPLVFSEIKGQPNRLHCVWIEITYWYREHEVKGLLIGDLDVQDVKYIHKTAIARKADFIVLPSYGGVTTHGAEQPEQLAELVEEVAKEIRDKGLVTVARPHPVKAEWADINLDIVAPQLCAAESL